MALVTPFLAKLRWMKWLLVMRHDLMNRKETGGELRPWFAELTVTKGLVAGVDKRADLLSKRVRQHEVLRLVGVHLDAIRQEIDEQSDQRRLFRG